MNKVSLEALQPLLERKGSHLISLYIPTHRAPTPVNMREDQVRLKNLISEAETRAKDTGADHQELGLSCDSLRSLLENQGFWHDTTEGLAIFVDGSYCEVFHLPMECDEYIGVGESFHTAPLLALCSYNQPYNLLALAVHEPKLFTGDMYGIEFIDLRISASPEEAMQIDEMHVNKLQPRGARVRQPNTGSAPGIFHGHGGAPRDVEDEARAFYFKQIDEAIAKHADTSLPLVVAATDNMATEFCQITQYKHVLKQHIDGNHTLTPTNELHALAWPIVEQEIHEKEMADLIEKFGEKLAHNTASVNLDEISEAAKQGRVDTLLVAIEDFTRDSVTDARNVIHKMTFPVEYAKLKVNERVAQVVGNGGHIRGLRQELMPKHSFVAATYRY